MGFAVTHPREDAVALWLDQRIRQSARQPVSSRPAYRRYHAHPKSNARDATRLLIKRGIDILGASCAIVFLAPLLFAIVIAIRATSPGPAIFSQTRYGRRNRLFRIYKFRTMYADRGDRSGRRQTTEGDSRITPIGRILRNTSLDELPQLFNVLKGDMSLVGPRPHVPGMLAGHLLYEQLVPYYFQRHIMKPGITGLAQVSGYRGSTAHAHDAIARIDLDLEYIENWSLWLDLKIIVKTCVQEFLVGTGS